MPQVSANRAPPEVLEKLRAIDPRARLVHLGGATWWLGIAETNGPAKKRLEKMMKQFDAAESVLEVHDSFARAMALERVAKEALMNQIMAYGVDDAGGFRPVELRECSTLADFHELVEDFRRADWSWKALGLKRVMEGLRDARERGLQLKDRIQADARSWWHHFVRQSVSILNPFGARKGPTAQED